MTLLELLIASSLIAVVLLGAIAVDYAVRSSRKDIRRKTNVSSQIAIAMYHLTRDALETIGDVSDRGIVYDEFSDIINICLRTKYDIEQPSNNRWTCYSMDVNSVNADHILYRCDDLTNFLLVGVGCNPDDPKTKALLTSSSDDFFDIIFDSEGQIDYIEFHLKTRDDPLSEAHVINNPETALISRISPLGVSRR